jgi:hypothetical protein
MVAYLFVGLSGLAIGLGRMFPRSPEGRLLDGRSKVYVNSYACALYTRSIAFLEPESATMREMELPESDSLDQASFSPWHDERGEVQVVGRWTKRSGTGFSALGQSFGIARMSYPSGQVLERIDTTVFPSSPPCWFPGTMAKILFAGGDGRLYRFAFEGAGDAATPGGGRDAAPVPLTWQPGVSPGAGRVFIRDVCWPADARLRGLILVTLSAQERAGDRVVFAASKLWWLRIDQDGTTIEAATPALGADPDDAAAPLEHERMPTVLPGRGGRPVLAYLSRRSATNEWKLQVAAVRFDAASQGPTIARRERRVVAEGCFPTAPALSPDGRWVVFIRHDRLHGPRIHRVPVGDMIDGNDFVGSPVHAWDGVAWSRTAVPASGDAAEANHGG